MTIIYLTIFFLIYSIVPFAYYFVRGAGNEPVTGFYIVVPNSFIAFGFSFAIISESFSKEWVSIIALLYALIFILMAAWMYREGRTHLNAFVVLLAKASFFLIITVPLLFKGPWITLFWVAQAMLLLWLGVRLERRSLLIKSYLLLIVAVGKFIFYDFSEIFGLAEGTFFEAGYADQFVPRIVLEIFTLSVLFFFMKLVKRENVALVNRGGDGGMYVAIFGFLLFVVLNIEVLAFFHDYLPDARNGALSVYWALFSVGVMLIGFRNNSSLVRRTAMVLFGITIGKVFLYDTAAFSTPYRILSFILVGLLLMGASFLYHRYRDEIIDAVSEEDEK